MRIAALLAISLLLFVGLGAALWIYESYGAAQRVEIEAIFVKGVEWRDWEEGPIRYPKTMRLKMALVAFNPTETTLEARLLVSDIYVLGRRVGELAERDILIEPGRSSVDFDVDVPLSSLRDVAIAYGRPAPLKIEIVGHLEVPIKAWGVKLFSVKIPYRHEQSLLP